MPATATRPRGQRKARVSAPGTALVPRRQLMRDMAALGLDWHAWWGTAGPWIDKTAADVLTRGPAPGTAPQWYTPASLNDWQESALAVAHRMAAGIAPELDAQVWRGHRDVHSGRPLPAGMLGGCGDGASVTASLIASPRVFSADPIYELDSATGELRPVPMGEAGEPGIYRNSREGEYTGPTSFPSQGGPYTGAPQRGSQDEPAHVAGDGDEPDQALDEGPLPETSPATTPSGTYDLLGPQPDGES